MENLQDIGFEQLADTKAVASKNIGLHQEWFSTDSSSLAVILARTQSFVPARPGSSESSPQVIFLFGAGVSFTSIRERLIGTSASVRDATAGEAVFATISHDSREIAKAKLKRLKAQQFAAEGREARIARALEILSLPDPSFRVDRETWVWAAEDPDIEDI